MKTVWLTLAMLLLPLSPARAAEYQGQNIDGRVFPAQVYSYETGAMFDAQVRFNGQQVNIEFPAGGRMIAKLQQSVIQNPSQIEVFGRPGAIPLGNFFSIGFNYTSPGDQFSANSSSSLGNFWRISIDKTHFNSQ